MPRYIEKETEDSIDHPNEFLQGIELIRLAEMVFSKCTETFNQRFTTLQLLLIIKAYQKSYWDILPDRWTDEQLAEAVRYGIVPAWEEHPVTGKLIPVLHKKQLTTSTTRNIFTTSVRI